ncbi:hypothetical protein SBA3_3470004 [Candidatus Sulfopaludibacter sp. SbA3]|nr:hypothetical protein SBA3_3470004 [Candidatus Sulfopaludibacter sp. SbA3]
MLTVSTGNFDEVELLGVGLELCGACDV